MKKVLSFYFKGKPILALGRPGYKKGSFPYSEHLAGHCLSLPIDNKFATDHVGKVIKALNGPT